jgi:hypothetical protein
MATTFDDAALREALAPPTVAEAEEAVAFWLARLATLPVYRRAARREAREMARRWEERLREARRRESLWHATLEALGVDRWRGGVRRVAAWAAAIGLALLVLTLAFLAIVLLALERMVDAVL